MNNTIEKIKGLTYGVEIECERITQKRAANIVAEVTGGTADWRGTHLNNYEVTQPDGRKWQVVSDGSLCGDSAEVVTPVMRYEDTETVQEVLRRLRRAGATWNERTGLHIHVGGGDMKPVQIVNLIKIFYKQEELILKAAGTQARRIGRYTRKLGHSFLEKVAKLKANATMNDLNEAWFGRLNLDPYHYDQHRYRDLNLNNFWGCHAKKTVEFRFFEGTGHAGILRANILLALSLVAFAKEAKAASMKNQKAYDETTAKFDFRVFLLRLGWKGEEFKNPRKHLLANLPGDAAFRTGRPARTANAQVAA